ncbi:MAG: GldG family protein [Proteobacteria bacterium]|nr:GldG family protein [Pseudomonadota bacterium]
MSQFEHPRVTMKGTSKMVGIAGAILVLAALFVFNYYPDQKAILAVLAIAGGASLLFFFIAERRLVALAPGSRAAKHGANAAAITLAFLGILVILNVLALRHNAKWDLTPDKRFTLAEQTVKVLKGLPREVRVTAFFSEASEDKARMKQVLDDFADETTKLAVSFVDPDKDPAAAQRLGIREYGTTVFESGDQSFRITETTEEAATNALVRVSREGKKTVYFLAGHGEHGIQDTQRSGYSAAKKALEDQGFAVKELLLLREAEVPTDCDVLVVAGPTKPLLEQERKAVETYLDRGGRAVLLLDPQTETGLEPLLAAWGVTLRNDVIVDTMSRLFGGSYTTPIVTEYPPHDITKGFQLATFLPFARSLEEGKLPEGVTFSPLARTTPQSWGETDLSNDKASFDPTQDHKGPLTVAAVVEKAGTEEKPGAQLVVVGDSDFPDNTYFGSSGNADLFQNMVSYLAKEQDLISIRPKDAKPSPLMLTRAQGGTLFYGSVVVAPLALVLAGLGIWWRRRNL